MNWKYLKGRLKNWRWLVSFPFLLVIALMLIAPVKLVGALSELLDWLADRMEDGAEFVLTKIRSDKIIEWIDGGE